MMRNMFGMHFTCLLLIFSSTCLINRYVNAFEPILSEKCSREELESRLFNTKHTACLGKYFNHTILAKELESSLIDDSLPTFMKNNCPKWSRAIECVDAYFDELSECLDFTQQFMLKKMKGVMQSIADYLCYDHGRRILEFIASGGLDCLSEQKEVFQHCFTTDVGDDIFSAADIEKGTLPRVNWSPKKFSGEECRVIYNASDCFLSAINKSCSPYTHEFFYNLIMGVINQTPCWGVLGTLENIEWEHYVLAGLLPKHIPSKNRICIDNDTAFVRTQMAMNNASVCWNGYVDNGLLIDDASNAYLTKALVPFLKKYCKIIQDASVCVNDFMDSFHGCVSDEEAITLTSTKSMVQNALKFLCHRDGERILLFLNEDGIECLHEKSGAIQECMTAAGVSGMFNLSRTFDISSIQHNFPTIWVPQHYNPEECREILVLERCIYKTMRTCKESSPANIISSLVKALSKQSPCLNVTINNGMCSAYSSSRLTIAVILSLLFVFNVFQRHVYFA